MYIWTILILPLNMLSNICQVGRRMYIWLWPLDHLPHTIKCIDSMKQSSFADCIYIYESYMMIIDHANDAAWNIQSTYMNCTPVMHFRDTEIRQLRIQYFKIKNIAFISIHWQSWQHGMWLANWHTIVGCLLFTIATLYAYAVIMVAT